MKHGVLALLLIMPALSVGAAEETMTPPHADALVTTPGVDATVSEAPALSSAPAKSDAPAISEAPAPSAVTASAAEKDRPTLVEKLKAQEANAPRTATPAWSNMIVGLVTVLGLILGLAWITKRLRERVPGLAGQLNIVESVALGPRERLCIVEVDGKRLLLGVTQQSITVLQSGDSLQGKDDSEAMFSEKIKKMLQNGTPNGR